MLLGLPGRLEGGHSTLGAANMAISDEEWSGLRKVAGPHQKRADELVFCVGFNRQGAFRKRRNGKTPQAERFWVKGESALLDRVVAIFLDQRPKRGRFFLNRWKAWYQPEGQGDVIFHYF